MIRVTAKEEPTRTIIAIDGQLLSEYIETVENCCNQAIAKGKPVQLFLRDVLTIDECGREFLSQVAARGVCLRAKGIYTSHVLRAVWPAGVRRWGSGSPPEATVSV